MTKAYYKMDRSKMFLCLQGHAVGSPEVCAGISAIVYALAGYLKNAEAENRANIYTIDLNSGNVELQVTGDDRTGGAFESAIIGLKQIAQKYPDYLKIYDPK